MARTKETVSLTLRPATIRAASAEAQAQRRSLSWFIDETLEAAMNGQGRLEALQAIADAGLAEYDQKASRKRGPNASEVIAADSIEGHRRLAALNKIAKAAR
jgi:hypothetical protein